MEGFVVTWWMWFLVGLLLLLAEFATPGAFFQFFFGVGAVTLGLLELAGLDMPLWAQLLLYLVLSLGLLIALRKPLQVRFSSSIPNTDAMDNLVGEMARAQEEIAVDAIGKVELRGSSWDARNVGDVPIAPAQRCRVERVDGLTIHIRG